MRFKPGTLLIAALILVCTMPLAMAAETRASAKARNIDTVNSDTRVGRDELVGNIDTVNGDIDLATGSAAGKIDTVNGDISTGDNVVIASFDTVNGDLDGGKHVRVEGDIDTVNGDISLKEGSEVGGRIDTVNGDIHVQGTVFKRDIETVNGDIVLEAASRVEGRIHVHKIKNGGWCLFGCSKKHNRPLIRISADSSVAEIILDREADLQIADGAKVGNIEHRYQM